MLAICIPLAGARQLLFQEVTPYAKVGIQRRPLGMHMFERTLKTCTGTRHILGVVYV